MLDLALDFLDAFEIEAGMFAEQAGGLRRHVVGFSQCFGSGEFHFQPLLVFVLVAPDVGHLGPGIAVDH